MLFKTNLSVSLYILSAAMCNFRNILLLIIIFNISIIHSQTPPYYNYTSSDGLASSTVFNMIQDKEGYIWFGTINGLSKFDGTRFINYKKEDGLNSNSITSIVEGTDKKLYLANYERGINVLDNKKIDNLFDNKNSSISAVGYMLEYNNKLYAYTPILNINIFDKNIINNIPTVLYAYPNLINRLAVLPNNTLVALTSAGLYKIIDKKLEKINIKGIESNNLTSYSKFNDESYLIGSEGAIYKIKNFTVEKKHNINIDYPSNVEYVFADSQGNIWFTVTGKGIYLINKNTDEVFNMGEKLNLQKTHVTNIMEDNEGNIWISTFGKGVYCFNNLYLRNYYESDGLVNNNINCITKDYKGRILIGTYKGINIFENNKIITLKNNSGKELMGDVNDIKVVNNNIYVVWSTIPSASGNAFVLYKDLIFNIKIARTMEITSDGYFSWGGWGNNISFVKEYDFSNNKIRYPIFYDSLFSNRVYDIKEDTKKNIWIATSLGAAKFSNLIKKDGKLIFDKTYFQNNEILNSRINYIYEDSKENIWFAGSKGVAKYNLKTQYINNYVNINNYDLSSANAVSSDNKNRIWVGTLKGLFILEENYIKYLNTKTGLPSDEILSLFYDNEKDLMYIGTSNGLSILNIKMFDEYVNPSLFVNIVDVKAGNSIYTDFKNLEFEPEQNNILVNLNALNFSSPGTVKYKYKINNNWNETEFNSLNLISLKHGKYDIEIVAKSQNTNWGKPVVLSFIIKPKFIETIWFYGLILIVLIGIIISIFIYRIKLNENKNFKEIEINERINQLKHQALSSMMNPHFIFNSLNSVQYLINFNKNEDANEYIAKMAKLIRKNLETAGNAFILLEEEISRLKLYLEIEKLRFREKFSFEIITGDDINPNKILIPNMILQPFVENSLWHGIINSGEKGLLTISFYFEEIEIESILHKSLIISVTDNGVGIKESQKNKKEDHISKGIEIIEERLKLLSLKMELPKPIMFEDLKNYDKNSHGTKVIISLPLPLYKIINN